MLTFGRAEFGAVATADTIIHITPITLLLGQPFEACHRRRKVAVQFFALSPGGRDPAPMPRQHYIAEKIGGHRQSIKTPLVMLWPDTPQH
jgi:hypothetical protein